MDTSVGQTPILVESYLEIFALQNRILEMVTHASAQKVLDELCRMLEALVPQSVASIMVLASATRKLDVLAAPSLPKALWEDLAGLEPAAHNGSCANVILSESAQFVGEIAEDTRWDNLRPLAAQYHLRACWSVPVFVDGAIVGTFALTSFKERMPSPFEKMLLSIGARVVGIVLKRDQQRQRNALLARVFESVNDAIVITDRANKIIETNHAFSTISGYSASAAQGLAPHFLLEPQSVRVLKKTMLDHIRSEGYWRGELQIRRADGRQSHEWVTASKLKDDQGRTSGFMYVMSDINDLKISQDRLAYLAYHDPLTGLANRALLGERIAHVISRATRENLTAVVLFLDLHRFKNINDSFGHVAGDQLIVEVAHRLESVTQRVDTVARFGGDEFVLLFEEVDDRKEIQKKAEAILAAIEMPFIFRDHHLRVMANIGIAVFPLDGNDADELLNHADTAMYQAKKSLQHICFYSPHMSQKSRQNLALEKELHEAVEAGEFDVYYQPIVHGTNAQIKSAEALVRWRHPRRGLVMPSEFITLAEETGLISRIDERVLEQVVTDLRRWHTDTRNCIVPVSVNISGRQINEHEVTRLIQLLNRSALARDYIGFELTETYLMQFAEETEVQLERLKHAGIKLSLDDFGTGYASLGYLKRFKIDTLKIDQALVRDIVSDLEDRSIVDAIVKMGHSLGLSVIAEGVETQAQLQTLRQFGCDAMQGFYFDRALEADVFEANYLRRER